MNAIQDVDGLSECIGRAIQEHLAKSNINVAWPQLDSLNHPILRVEAFLEDAGPNNTTRARSEKIASVRCLAVIIPRRTIPPANVHAENVGSSWYGDTSVHAKSCSGLPGLRRALVNRPIVI